MEPTWSKEEAEELLALQWKTACEKLSGCIPKAKAGGIDQHNKCPATDICFKVSRGASAQIASKLATRGFKCEVIAPDDPYHDVDVVRVMLTQWAGDEDEKSESEYEVSDKETQTEDEEQDPILEGLADSSDAEVVVLRQRKGDKK